MASLKNNGKELLRYKEIITYPEDNADCIIEQVNTYSVRANGYILRKIQTRYNVTDGLLNENYNSGWKRYKKFKDNSNLILAAEKIRRNVLNAKSYHLKSNAVLHYEL